MSIGIAEQEGMPCCVAPNCSNRSEKGFKLYSFPADEDRRQKWIENVNRADWAPTRGSRLCEKHFEESQFEKRRADGWRKLKPNAIPTIFDPFDPLAEESLNKKGKKRLSNTNVKETEFSRHLTEVSKDKSYPSEYFEGNIVFLLEENSNSIDDQNEESLTNSCEFEMGKVKAELKDSGDSENEVHFLDVKESKLDTNLALLRENKKLKERLRETKTEVQRVKEENEKLRENVEFLNNRLRSFLDPCQIQLLQHGRVHEWSKESTIMALKFRYALSIHGYNFLRSTGYPLLSYSTLCKKVQDLNLDFGLFYDVLELLNNKVKDMDDSDRFCVLSYDETTLNFTENGLDQKIITVLIRGVMRPWKQVIGCHLTPIESTDRNSVKEFMIQCIDVIEKTGLQVVALSINLNETNKHLLHSLDININSQSFTNSFRFSGRNIYVIPDVCHILKNLKASFLKMKIRLPQAYVEAEKLPTDLVEGRYVQALWDYERTHANVQKSLDHLSQEDVYPSQSETLKGAINVFSSETAVALETAAANDILERKALTTAAFVRLVDKWFSLIASKNHEMSITSKNCDIKFIFLHQIVHLFHEITFDGRLKLLNRAIALATLSFADVAELLLKNGFDYVFGHRFTQDAIESVYSQVLKREGKSPTPHQCLGAIRDISVTQYAADFKRRSYLSDDSVFDFCETDRKSNDIGLLSDVASASTSPEDCTPMEIATFPIEEFYLSISSIDFNKLFHLASSLTSAVLRGNLCATCGAFLVQENLPGDQMVHKAKMYLSSINQNTGLKQPCFEVLCMVLHCEHFSHETVISENSSESLIELLVKDVDVSFPLCLCDIKRKIVRNFFEVHSCQSQELSKNSKKRKVVYDTLPTKKKKA